MNKRSALIFSAGLFLLAVAFFVIFLYNGTGNNQGEIILPQGSAELTENVDIAQRNNDKMQEAKVDSGNVQEIIKSLERPREYELVADVIYYYENKSESFVSTIWTNDSSQRGQVKTDEGKIERNVLKTSGSVYIWGEKSDSYYKTTSNRFTLEDEIRIPTYESVLELSRDSILKAETTNYEGRFCIYLQSLHDDGEITREWYIDVANCLLIACDTKDNGKIIYSMHCNSLKVEKQSEDLFAVPTISIPTN